MRTQEGQTVGPLKKTFQILELIADSPKGLRLAEISERAGFTESTAYRLLCKLERERYLVRNNLRAYALGIKFIEMATHGNYVENLRSISWQFLLDLRRTVLETVSLAVPGQGLGPVYRGVWKSPFVSASFNTGAETSRLLYFPGESLTRLSPGA
jgi:IclR family transcriptional regulator, KDG regulon repressor